jgi:hypothetical protein
VGTERSVPTLRLSGVTKRFDTVTANDAVDLELFGGEFPESYQDVLDALNAPR